MFKSLVYYLPKFKWHFLGFFGYLGRDNLATLDIWEIGSIQTNWPDMMLKLKLQRITSARRESPMGMRKKDHLLSLFVLSSVIIQDIKFV